MSKRMFFWRVAVVASTGFLPLCAWAQAPAAGAAASVADASTGGAALGADLSAVELGDPFRSRAAGIELRPPAGATIIRQPGSDEIVRFFYPERGWDIHVKMIDSSKPVPLSMPRTPTGEVGLLELSVDQITAADPSAQILQQEVKTVGGNDVAEIVARHRVSGTRELLQEAIVCRNETEYYAIQFTTRLDPAPTPAAQANDDAKEQTARQAFALMLQTVSLLDRKALLQEQDRRLYRTEELYHELDEAHIKSVLVPRQVMRVVRDGRDVGYILQTEQLANHADHDGVEVDSRSHIEAEPAKPDHIPPHVVPGGQVIDLPKPSPVDATPVQLVKVDRITKLFVTFDRRHEDWSVITRIDNGKTAPAMTSELGNSDMEVHEVLDREALMEHKVTDPTDPKQPPVHMDEKYTLSVTHYTPTGTSVPFSQQLQVFYLPAALAQLLPRLLPLDSPSTYMFSSYVSEENQVMARYVDVQAEREVTLDGKTILAVPITDRIGIDGSPTTNYMTHDGHWLGSVSPEQKLVVLESDPATINALWHGALPAANNGAPPTSDNVPHTAAPPLEH